MVSVIRKSVQTFHEKLKLKFKTRLRAYRYAIKYGGWHDYDLLERFPKIVIPTSALEAMLHTTTCSFFSRDFFHNIVTDPTNFFNYLRWLIVSKDRNIKWLPWISQLGFLLPAEINIFYISKATWEQHDMNLWFTSIIIII